MTSTNYPRAFDLVIRSEGGYVNDPNDNGGPTNKGITQATYDKFRVSRKLGTRTVRLIEDSEVRTIYRYRYWDAVQGDWLRPGIDYAMFDFAVNSGPERAIKFLQRVVGADDDGVLGEKTRMAMGKLPAVLIIDRLIDARLAWLKTLSDWKHFGKGWTNRLRLVREEASRMAKGDPVPVTPPAVEVVLPRTTDPIAAPPKPVAPVVATGLIGLVATLIAAFWSKLGDLFF